MNVNPVGFGAKLPVSRIKYIETAKAPVDDYVKMMVNDNRQILEQMANVVDKDVLLSQRNKLLLVNSGARTSVIDMNKMKHGDELIDGIKNNINLNA